eukprot:268496-Alexandrium_andersonii.AAC.1
MAAAFLTASQALGSCRRLDARTTSANAARTSTCTRAHGARATHAHAHEHARSSTSMHTNAKAHACLPTHSSGPTPVPK